VTAAPSGLRPAPELHTPAGRWSPKPDATGLQVSIDCGRTTMTAETSFGGAAVEVKCRRWSCEVCGPQRRASVIRQALNGSPTRFVTITCRRRDGVTPEDAARELVRAWRIVIRLFRKLHQAAEVEYFAVFEATRLGWPHMHLLLRSPFMAQRWLSAQMARLIGSPVVDIRRVDPSKRPAAYVAKYIGKDLHRFGTLKRYWQSKGYQSEEDKSFERTFPSDLTWERRDLPIAMIRADWIRYGYPIREHTPGVITWGTFSTGHLARAAVAANLRTRWEGG